MPGTLDGALKARETHYRKYGNGYYAKIGAKGGRLGKTGGFAHEGLGKDGLTGRERARIVGRKGGAISRRGNKS